MDHQQSNEIVAFIVKGQKLTEELLKEIMRSHGKGIIKNGKQSLNNLSREGCTLQNIEVTDQNIKSFEQTARKYDLDYALKKDNSEPPVYFVFFQGKDIRTMEKAFAEYSYIAVNQKASVKEKINSTQRTQNQNRERTKEKHKDRGMDI